MEQETRSGTVVGSRYRLISELESGGFGSVWSARDEILRVNVLVRRVPATVARLGERLNRVAHTARVLADLRHPNIVAIKDIVIDDDVVWTVTPLIAGRSLEERIAVAGPLWMDEAAKVATALLSALGAVHEAGIVHGNLVPANVLLADRGDVLLTGFEFALGHAGIDDSAADDLSSLGMTLHQAVVGFPPLDSYTRYIAPQLRGEPLAQLIAWLMGKDPDQRRTGPEVSALIDSVRSLAPRDVAFPVTIYLSDEAAHRDVEAAVEDLLQSEGATVIGRDDPILGSWFRRLRAGMRSGRDSPLTREVGRTAAHALDARFVLAQDAANTATLMQPLGPVLASLQPVKEAVIRVGALLIVKVDDAVAVHQLTASQQLRLDHHPSLLSSPRDILGALDLAFPHALTEPESG